MTTALTAACTLGEDGRGIGPYMWCGGCLLYLLLISKVLANPTKSTWEDLQIIVMKDIPGIKRRH